jgi:hypothetical protein
VVSREDDNPDELAILRGQALIDHSAGRGDAVGAGHAYIHQHHIRTLSADLRQGFLTVGGLSDDGDVVLGVDQHCDAGSYQRLVIDYHDSDHGDTFLDLRCFG